MRPDQEATQETPKGHPIPVPTREDVLGDLARVARRQTSWLREYEGLGLQDAKARAEAEGRTFRVIAPHSGVTLDYRLDRLNLHVDDDGSLTRMSAG